MSEDIDTVIVDFPPFLEELERAEISEEDKDE